MSRGSTMRREASRARGFRVLSKKDRVRVILLTLKQIVNETELDKAKNAARAALIVLEGK